MFKRYSQISPSDNGKGKVRTITLKDTTPNLIKNEIKPFLASKTSFKSKYDNNNHYVLIIMGHGFKEKPHSQIAYNTVNKPERSITFDQILKELLIYKIKVNRFTLILDFCYSRRYLNWAVENKV